MKKLMIALAAVAMTAFAQAASVDWQFTETAQVAKNPLDISSYTAYLFTADAWSAVLATDIGAGIDKSAFTGWTGSTSITATSIGGGKGVTYSTGTKAIVSEGLTGSYYIILSDLESGYIASSALTATQFESATEQHDTAKWTIAASDAPITAVTGTFAGAVPEPTSGLLLLLGMAGLALRRRRA